MLQLGRTVATPTFLAVAEEHNIDVIGLIRRHASGDWGDVGKEDAQSNRDAIKYGNRVMSVYKVNETTKVWVITEADRSVTTLLMPEDY